MVQRNTSSNNSVLGGLYALLFLASFPSSVQSFQPTCSLASASPIRQRQPLQSSPTSLQSTVTSLNAVAQRQSFIIDGGELQSFLLHNNGASAAAGGRNSQQAGCLTLVTGTTDESPSRRVVGVEKSNDNDQSSYDTVSIGNVQVYKHTMATIPDKVSDGDAMSTAAATVVGIHCAIPKVEEVGGSVDAVFYSGKAVVLGGNDYACFLADGLATLGIDVSLVTTGGAKTRNKQVDVMQPSVDIGDDEVGFASAIGQFDSLIDTVSNEQKGMVITNDNPTGGSSVLQLLQSRHQCDKYISTLTQSQQIIKNGGVLFGPGKANSHVKSMESISPKKCMPLVPSLGFGPSTLQILLENNVLFSTKNTKPTAVRGWELKDFWEETSWPRDSSGTGVRFGLPVVEDDDLDELFRIEQIQLQKRRTRVGSEEGGLDDKEVKVVSKVDERNPYVTKIEGVEGLAEEVISKRKSCVVFVAMRSCRTCKGINPIFTKMARDSDGVGDYMMFAKADASGAVGKALGKQLGIVAVPTFVLFRNGVRFGAVSASKLPSDRLDKAIYDLKAGEEFDTSLEEEDDN
mmetsp:Transcript_23009/g.49798  ORF Transcript_23009/g.49798 Transcript_23009/m.49798 type:complete len:572 (+) Transcript_23009:141-1856(+)|eukprot:CAMPEP_0172315006 /NCGR_PEP_ID=MMETSP1058-20130122/23811_1 /TAXON_ID=83371 /ORGANISM="Detonula confervacea, Strain CCMP 353" /LENGTH=571 /DNA_ID=CAMNT_0013028985 /DNA_START=63 /DNA_END=1778 /DNA_ORIENTATION=+